MLDSQRISKVLSPNFIWSPLFNADEYNYAIIDYEKNILWQKKIACGEHFTCKLCNTHTDDFNFKEFDQTYTNPERMWCCNCEEWWNGRQGYEKTMLEKIRREIVKLYMTLSDEWEIVRCNDMTEYFFNKQTNKTQYEHPFHEEKLQELAKQFDEIKTQYNI